MAGKKKYTKDNPKLDGMYKKYTNKKGVKVIVEPSLTSKVKGALGILSPSKSTNPKHSRNLGKRGPQINKEVDKAVQGTRNRKGNKATKGRKGGY